MSPKLTDGFFTTESSGKPCYTGGFLFYDVVWWSFPGKKINIHISLYLGLVSDSKESGSTAISAPMASMRIQQALDTWALSLQNESDHGH